MTRFDRRRRHLLGGLLAGLVAGAAAQAGEAVPCPRFSQQPSPAATPRGDRHALDRMARINQMVASMPYRVLFFGDLITEGWAPRVWDQSLAPRGVLNAGVGGDRTDHLLWRLQHGNLAGPPPQAVILLIGTNDLGAGRTPELTADGIRSDLLLLRQRLPDARILLLGLLPREESPAAPLRRATAQVNALVSGCADGEHIAYREIGDVLLDNGGRLDAAVSPDRLHFTERGYQLLASRLDPILDRLLAAGR